MRAGRLDDQRIATMAVVLCAGMVPEGLHHRNAEPVGVAAQGAIGARHLVQGIPDDDQRSGECLRQRVDALEVVGDPRVELVVRESSVASRGRPLATSRWRIPGADARTARRSAARSSRRCLLYTSDAADE